MTALTTQARYDQLDSAITAIENGAQEYRVGTKMLRRADLSVLYQERRKLMTELAAEQSAGGTYVAAFYRG